MTLLECGSRVRRLWREHTAIVLLLAAHIPFVAYYYWGLWKFQSHYQFFPFAVTGFAWLFCTRKQLDQPEKWGVIPRTLIVADLICVCLGVLSSSPWLFAAGMCSTLTAWCWVSKDEGYFRRLTYLSLLPLLTLRLPGNGDVQVIQLLQALTTTVASRTLQRFGYLHYQSGTILNFPGKRFLVEEACSGVQSLFTILFIAAMVICVRRRSLAHGMVLLLSGVVFAGIMNVLRVISIAMVWSHYQLDLSTGFRHDLLGYGCLSVAALLLMSADTFLAFITDPVPDVQRPGPVEIFRNPLITLWNWLFTVIPEPALRPTGMADQRSAASPVRTRSRFGIVAAFCAMLLAAQAFALLSNARSESEGPTSQVTVLSEESLPEVLSGFSRTGYTTETRERTSELGHYSNLWDYAGAGIKARVACDHPFPEWHPLQQCYVSQGWQVNSTGSELSNGWRALVVRLSHPTTGRNGLLIYSLFDKSGRPVQPPGLENPGAMIMNRLFRGTSVGLLDPVCFQSQVFVETAIAVDNRYLEPLLKLHFASRETMRQQITGRNPK